MRLGLHESMTCDGNEQGAFGLGQTFRCADFSMLLSLHERTLVLGS